MKLRVLLTDGCNAGCLFCHNEGQSKPSKKFDYLTPQTYNCILNLLEIKKDIPTEVCLSGGEPTLSPHLHEICKLSKAKQIYLSIVTNGSFPQKMQQIIPYIDEVKVHLESFEPTKQQEIMGVSLEKQLETIRLCQENGITTLINAVYGGNDEQIKELINGSRQLLIPLKIIIEEGKGLMILRESLKLLLIKEGYQLCASNEFWKGDHTVLLKDCETESCLYIHPTGDINSMPKQNTTAKEIEYRWAISESFFYYLTRNLNISQFQYMRDETFLVNDKKNAFYRIKDRGGLLSYDKKYLGDQDERFFNEENFEFKNYKDALDYFSAQGTKDLVIEKFRAIKMLNNIEISLDYVIDLGYFVELESKDEESIPNLLSLASQLGLQNHDFALPYGKYLSTNTKPLVCQPPYQE